MRGHGRLPQFRGGSQIRVRKLRRSARSFRGIRHALGLGNYGARRPRFSCGRALSRGEIFRRVPPTFAGGQHRAKRLSKGATSFAIGMGMGEGDAYSWVRYLLDETGCMIALDADGLKCAPRIADFKGRAVLTPHIGEFCAMTGIAKEDAIKNAAELSRRYAAEHDCVLVLKSHESHISDGREVWRNSTGNSKLAKGGSGDVLAGIIGGLLAWAAARTRYPTCRTTSCPPSRSRSTNCRG